MRRLLSGRQSRLDGRGIVEAEIFTYTHVYSVLCYNFKLITESSTLCGPSLYTQGQVTQAILNNLMPPWYVGAIIEDLQSVI